MGNIGPGPGCQTVRINLQYRESELQCQNFSDFTWLVACSRSSCAVLIDQRVVMNGKFSSWLPVTSGMIHPSSVVILMTCPL